MLYRILPVACLCTACASVNPAGVGQLSALSPLATDPAEIALALDLPDGVGVQPEGSVLTLSARREDTGETTENKAALAGISDPEQGIIFRIDPKDQAGFRATQNQISEWKAEAPEATKGSLSLALAPCKDGAGPTRDARVSAALQTGGATGFIPLITNLPVDQISDELELDNWPQCE